METEVLSVTNNLVTIRCGLYDITFRKTPDGKVMKWRFTIWKSRMEGSYIPPEIFNPAIRRTRAIFADRSKRRGQQSQKRLF